MATTSAVHPHHDDDDDEHRHQWRHVAVMSRKGAAVHGLQPPGGGIFPELCSTSPVRLTVWCKSLLFNGEGYTVYEDSTGRMVFRVDNYAHNWREEAVLMDSVGHVLLTVRRCRRKNLGFTDSWEAYKGDRDVQEMNSQHHQGRRHIVPLFRATKSLGNSSCNVTMASGNGIEPHGYRMNWSRQKDWSKIYQATADSMQVAEVRHKAGVTPEARLGKDVLALRVHPCMDQALVMAMLMITDAMG